MGFSGITLLTFHSYKMRCLSTEAVPVAVLMRKVRLCTQGF
jgi:hypothetical protein